MSGTFVTGNPYWSVNGHTLYPTDPTQWLLLTCAGILFDAPSYATPSNGTWNFGTGDTTIGGVLQNGAVLFDQLTTVSFRQETAPDDTAGNATAHYGQKGGQAVAVAGKAGGPWRAFGGIGGDGTAALAAGPGAAAALYGGAPGVDNGGGWNTGGPAYVDGAAGTTHGPILIGTQSTPTRKTSRIDLGNATDVPPINLKSPAVVQHQWKETHANADATPYNVAAADGVVAVKTNAARTVQLPALAGMNGRILKVGDRIGTAPANPITVAPSGAEKINGVAASVTIDWAWGWLWLMADESEATWIIIGGW